MKILSLVQGSEEWLAARAAYNTASEAPAVMGEGKTSRAELLRMKATGAEQEFSKWTLEVLFAKGHEVEELARPIAEHILGDELFPVTGVDESNGLLASFDGLTMDESVCWECKQWNEAKAADVRAGNIPKADYWQVVQQLLVSGASKALYMVTDGTQENTVYCWLKPNSGDAEALLSHWDQFVADLVAYVPAPVVAEPVGRSPDELPALRLEVTGAVTASNLEAFKDHALSVFAGIRTDLSTDADFADAEKTVKWCKSVEQKLEAAKQSALEQTASIDELFRAIDAISGEARTKRLELDRAVKSRKETLRAEIVADAQGELAGFLLELSEGFPVAGIKVPAAGDFAAAMKGKRTMKSLRDAVDGALASAKVEAARSAAVMGANLEWYGRHQDVYGGLFPDLQDLVLQECEPFQAVVHSRIKTELDREESLAAKTETPPAASVVKPAKAAIVDDALPPESPGCNAILDLVSAHYGVDTPTAWQWLVAAVKEEAA